MAYTYHNWSSQTSDADKLSRLRLHIDEVSAQMGPNLSSGGHSRSTDSLNNYLDKLYKQRDILEGRVAGSARAAAVSVARFN